MKIVDSNVLIYAVNEQSLHHRTAYSWLSQAVAGAETIALAWTSILAFLRITTSRRAFEHPLTLDTAAALVGSWLSRPTCVVVEPGPRHLQLLTELLARAGTAGNLTTDAHLAALALEQRAGVVSFDRDFARFGVDVLVPPDAG